MRLLLNTVATVLLLCAILDDLGPRDAVHRRVLQAIAYHPATKLLGSARIAQWSGLEALWQHYRRVEHDTPDFAASMLAELQIGWETTLGSRTDIPCRGPLLVVANHPTGGAEGLIALSLLSQRRGDVKLFANGLLDHIPEITHQQFSVGNAETAIRTMRAAVRHLRSGGAVLMFPAGTVAHWQKGRGFAEAPWHGSASGLARLTGAAVQPLQFTAKTTWRWRLLSAFSKRARTALLPLELLAQRGQTIKVSVTRTLIHPEEIAVYFRDRG